MSRVGIFLCEAEQDEKIDGKLLTKKIRSQSVSLKSIFLRDQGDKYCAFQQSQALLLFVKHRVAMNKAA